MSQTILLANDSKIVQKAIEIALATYQVKLYKSNNYKETRDFCKQHMPDLVIINATLPGTSRVDDFSKLKEISTKTKLLIIESSLKKIVKEDYLDFKLDYFIQKPFSAKELIDILEKKIKLNLRPLPKEKTFPSNTNNANKESPVIQKDLITPVTVKASPKELNLSLDDTFMDPHKITEQINHVVSKYCEENLYKITKEIVSNKLEKLLKEKEKSLEP